MDIRAMDAPGGDIAIAALEKTEAPGAPLQTTQDMLDLLATVSYAHGCQRLVLPKACLPEAFFELKTGLAGEMLQKVSNYNFQLAIVGDFSGFESKALRDFIRESNRGSGVRFAPDEAAALAWMKGE